MSSPEGLQNPKIDTDHFATDSVENQCVLHVELHPRGEGMCQ